VGVTQKTSPCPLAREDRGFLFLLNSFKSVNYFVYLLGILALPADRQDTVEELEQFLLVFGEKLLAGDGHNGQDRVLDKLINLLLSYWLIFAVVALPFAGAVARINEFLCQGLRRFFMVRKAALDELFPCFI
jgi:hypothetical protein